MVAFQGGHALLGVLDELRADAPGFRLRLRRPNGRSERLNIPWLGVRFLRFLEPPALAGASGEDVPPASVTLLLRRGEAIEGKLRHWAGGPAALLVETTGGESLLVPPSSLSEVVWRPRPGEAPPSLAAGYVLVEDARPRAPRSPR
jgi:hypothetical protein